MIVNEASTPGNAHGTPSRELICREGRKEEEGGKAVGHGTLALLSLRLCCSCLRGCFQASDDESEALWTRFAGMSGRLPGQAGMNGDVEREGFPGHKAEAEVALEWAITRQKPIPEGGRMGHPRGNWELWAAQPSYYCQGRMQWDWRQPHRPGESDCLMTWKIYQAHWS